MTQIRTSSRNRARPSKLNQTISASAGVKLASMSVQAALERQRDVAPRAAVEIPVPLLEMRLQVFPQVALGAEALQALLARVRLLALGVHQRDVAPQAAPVAERPAAKLALPAIGRGLRSMRLQMPVQVPLGR